jgi:hypothetical protein
MAREKTAINVDIWGDADFRNLTAQAQSLYFKLMSHPKLDYCGVVEFHPGRLAALSREQTAGDVMVAAQELSQTFYCVFDQDTDEVMVRGLPPPRRRPPPAAPRRLRGEGVRGDRVEQDPRRRRPRDPTLPRSTPTSPRGRSRR